MSKILLFYVFPTIYKCKKLTNIQKQVVGQVWPLGCSLLTSTLEYLIKIFLKFSIIDQMYIPMFTLRPSQKYLSRLSPPNSRVSLGLPTSTDAMVFGRRGIDQICDGVYLLLGIEWSATHLAAGFQLIM